MRRQSKLSSTWRPYRPSEKQDAIDSLLVLLRVMARDAGLPEAWAIEMLPGLLRMDTNTAVKLERILDRTRAAKRGTK